MDSILNYLLFWFAPQIYRFYLYSFDILLSRIIMFLAIEKVEFTLLDYHLGWHKLLAALVHRILFLCVSASAGSDFR